MARNTRRPQRPEMACGHCGERFSYGDEEFAEPGAETAPDHIHVIKRFTTQRWSILCLCGHFTILEPG